MMSLDGTSSTALPPINYLDIEKIKKDEAADYRVKDLAPPLASPTLPHTQLLETSSRPPLSAASLPGSLNGLTSPPDSRRTSGDEKESSRNVRQSLPSIHEALGSDKPFPPPSATSTSKFAPSPFGQSQGPTSSPQTASRPFGETGQTDSSLPPPIHSPYVGHQPTSIGAAGQSPAPLSDTLERSTFPRPQNAKLPTLHPIQTGSSTFADATRSQSTHPYSHQQCQQSPTQEHPPRSAGSMNPPSHGLSAYTSQTTYSESSYSSSASSRHPPAWRSDVAEGGRTDDSKRVRLSGSTYGNSVKRHLETYDVEASLNEIKERATSMLVLAQRYNRPMLQSPISRVGTSNVPSLAEIDEHIQSARLVQDSFHKIRDIIVAQQTSLAAEQAQEQRCKSQGYELDELQRQRQQQQHSSYIDEHKSASFGSSDAKKRRARAAPPGRCHSCNRAETPEWRRGPDGARTLCNACGLHYAKLTKKMGTNKTAIGSSNLQPKSLSGTAAPL